MLSRLIPCGSCNARVNSSAPLGDGMTPRAAGVGTRLWRGGLINVSALHRGVRNDDMPAGVGVADWVAPHVAVAVQPIQHRIGGGELPDGGVVIARAVVIEPRRRAPPAARCSHSWSASRHCCSACRHTARRAGTRSGSCCSGRAPGPRNFLPGTGVSHSHRGINYCQNLSTDRIMSVGASYLS